MPTKTSLGTDVTGLLQSWQAGDEHTFNKLVAVVYHEPHRAARRYMITERPAGI